MTEGRSMRLRHSDGEGAVSGSAAFNVAGGQVSRNGESENVNDASNRSWAGKQGGPTLRRSPAKLWGGAGIAIAAVGVGGLAYSKWEGEGAGHPPPPAPPQVLVSKPPERELDARVGFL